MDLVYFGSGAFGLPTLKTLVESHQVRAIVTQPDRPAGRGKALTPTPIGQWAVESAPDVPLLKPKDVNADEVVARVRAFEAEAWVVIAFGQKLSAALLEGVFSMNLHASLLPRWRGAAPINWAIIAGDDETGNSVITLAHLMDAGLVLGQSRREITGRETAGEMHDALAADGPALVEEVLEAKSAGMLMPVEQDERKVTLAPKLSSADRWVDVAQPAAACQRRIHGLTPWPGVSVDVGGVPPQGVARGSGRGRRRISAWTADRRGTRGRVLWRGHRAPARRGPAARKAGDGVGGLRARARARPWMCGGWRPGAVTTLWDLLKPERLVKPQRRARPQRPTMADRYERMTREMLARYDVRVRKWRSSMSGVAWQVIYADGRVSRLIESPQAERAGLRVDLPPRDRPPRDRPRGVQAAVPGGISRLGVLPRSDAGTRAEHHRWRAQSGARVASVRGLEGTAPRHEAHPAGAAGLPRRTSRDRRTRRAVG